MISGLFLNIIIGTGCIMVIISVIFSVCAFFTGRKENYKIEKEIDKLIELEKIKNKIICDILNEIATTGDEEPDGKSQNHVKYAKEINIIIKAINDDNNLLNREHTMVGKK